jgi:hypothetical protein
MSLLPREASYAEEIADYFLAFKGSGLALSALDTELLLSWQRRGVPREVVCRAIRRTAELRKRTARPGEPVLANLRACARAVDEEFKKYQGLAAGAGAAAEAGGPGDRMSKARSALKRALRLSPPPVRAAIERVLPLAGRKAETPGEAAALVARMEEALALLYLRALPFAERRALWARAREELGGALRQRSPRARKASLRAYRVLHAKEHGKLPELR